MKLSTRLPGDIFKNVLEQSQLQLWRNEPEVEPEAALLSQQEEKKKGMQDPLKVKL